MNSNLQMDKKSQLQNHLLGLPSTPLRKFKMHLQEYGGFQMISTLKKMDGWNTKRGPNSVVSNCPNLEPYPYLILLIEPPIFLSKRLES